MGFAMGIMVPHALRENSTPVILSGKVQSLHVNFQDYRDVPRAVSVGPGDVGPASPTEDSVYQAASVGRHRRRPLCPGLNQDRPKHELGGTPQPSFDPASIFGNGPEPNLLT